MEVINDNALEAKDGGDFVATQGNLLAIGV